MICTSVLLARRLVNDGAVFQAPQIEHADTTVLTTTDEHINTVRTKAHVVHFFIVCDQLRLGRQRGDIPDRTRRIDAGSDDQAGRNSVPVQRGERGSVIWCL